MRFDVITLFPEMIDKAADFSILQRASQKNLFQLNTINPRDYTLDKHKKVDDTPYGGGAGMVLYPQPYFSAYENIEKLNNFQTILLTPQGETFNNKIAQEFASLDQLILICGHYEGFDERIRTGLNVREISIGDFVLTGGELPALCIIDSVLRFQDGILGKSDSSEYDSFEDGLLEYPQYTKPRNFNGLEVPEVLLNGNHAEIEQWRRKEQILRTKEKRPDLYEKFLNSDLSKTDIKILKELDEL